MFIASKLLAFMTQPLAWVLALLLMALVGLFLRRHWGRHLVLLACLTLGMQGWEPLPDALLRQLENQYPGPDPKNTLPSYAGMVVLGGALEPAFVWDGRTQPALNDAAERMTAPLALMQQHPKWKLLFTGGEGDWWAEGLSEAARAQLFFASVGVAPNRLLFESKSRTTYENAVLSAALPSVNPTLPWMLVTSASHMPRAMATFRQAGWNVTAYPVDYRTGAHTPWGRYSLARGAQKWHLVLHELAGLLAYRLAGRA